MPKSCCCYVINSGYLFPTLHSAKQVRAATSRASTHIQVFCIGRQGPDTTPFVSAYKKEEIELTFVPEATIENMPIAFARFFLWRLLDPQYEAVVYIDGDTQISGSLQPLLDVTLEPGRFLAVRDPMSLIIDRPDRMWRKRRDYFHSIGIEDDALNRYCNSGVLRFNLQDWKTISMAVMSASKTHFHSLRFSDQDPLNLVFGADYLAMSYRWNFPIFFLNFGFENFINPNIYHFMSNPRPWNGAFHPWRERWYAPYPRLGEIYPELKAFLNKFGAVITMRYLAQQQIKRVLEGPTWRSRMVRERLLRNEQDAYV
jgi:lipopolysaccharide biosynthesis glycosyltransferase